VQGRSILEDAHRGDAGKKKSCLASRHHSSGAGIRQENHILVFHL